MNANQAEPHLARLADAATLAKLTDLRFDWTPLDRNVCLAALFKRVQKPRPVIVGLLGGACSGKSTVFNSLLGRQVSRISAHAHETIGPIAAVHTDWAARFEGWARDGLMFPDAQPVSLGPRETTAGRVGAVHLYAHDLEPLRNIVLIDLPDVTSKQAADQGSITRTLLPWFDGLIVVVDEERWFDAAVFDGAVAYARNLGPLTWVVFNRTEYADGAPTAPMQQLADHAASRHADGYCLSTYAAGTGYRPLSADTCRRIAEWLSTADARDRGAVLEDHLRRRCADLLRVNVLRSRQFDDLSHAVNRRLEELTAETSLTTDLLTDDERQLLGIGHRFVPMYGLLRQIGHRLGRLGRARADRMPIDFEKRVEALAHVLRRNLEHRFRHASDALDHVISNSPYVADDGVQWTARWTLPPFDEMEWATRIGAHIDAWKAETTVQARRGDVTALSIGIPLLVADLLFLGGGGVTLTWATAWVAGLVGGKGLVRAFQRSPAFKQYQTTVRAYQACIREALMEQCARNLAAIPRRHLPMTDPILASIMAWSTPTARRASGW